MMLAYPFMAPLFLWLDKPMYLVVFLAGILLLLGLDRIQTRDLKGAGLTLFSLLFILTLYLFHSASLIVFVPPVLIPLALFFLFHQSLNCQATPLITRYAEIIDGTITTERKVYTRKLTEIWRAVFLFLAIESSMLAVFAPLEIWAWFTHVINYLVIFLLFCLEYIYRRYRFGKASMSFFSYLKRISNLRPKDLVDSK